MEVSLTFCFAVIILASITEGGKAIWKNDSFIDGVVDSPTPAGMPIGSPSTSAPETTTLL
jgi:hypothetical protein